MASRTDDFPEDWPPTTTICGRSVVVVCPKAPRTSCSFDAIGISWSILEFPIYNLKVISFLFFIIKIEGYVIRLQYDCNGDDDERIRDGDDDDEERIHDGHDDCDEIIGIRNCFTVGV